ncbi:hypothetical protein OAJ94_01535 [Deltaproteobacteria bacterium]|nr:hypothetical protein [Deltaproteobacteria bacterium]
MSMFVDEPTEDEDDIDPFEALNVSTTAPAVRGAKLLDAFGEDNDEDGESEGESEAITTLEMGGMMEMNEEIVDSVIPLDEAGVNEEEDIDPFEELGATRPDVVASTSTNVSDALAAFMDEDEYQGPENTIVFEGESATEDEPIEQEEVEEKVQVEDEKPRAQPEELYRFLLEGVWVDDVLDPAEVALMARKRRELGISFETHLKILKQVLHD